MNKALPAAYCFFQDIEPRPLLDLVFDRDYLLYAVTGALHVTVAGQRWFLPPSFAAWVPADVPFTADIRKPMTTCSVLARPGFCALMPRKPVAFQMSPMARQMIRYCKDWGADGHHMPEAEGFFEALLNVCARLAESSLDVRRPSATEPTLQKAIDVTEMKLAEKITAVDVARSINRSERSMQRDFAENVGMTWSEVLTRLRVIRAIELLCDHDLSIIQVAGLSGYNSLSAFNRAFLRFAGCTPSAFRAGLGS
ncbi:MAG: helix-turn-helix transcriptional regulator [Pseudomonadota bacterium]